MAGAVGDVNTAKVVGATRPEFWEAGRAPAIPARKLETAKARSFVRTRSIPTDAAARSLARTASIRRPVDPRLMLATAATARMSTIETKMPKGTLGRHGRTLGRASCKAQGFVDV